jgi:hypothetical protein
MSQPEPADSAEEEVRAPSPELLAKVQDLLSNITLVDIRPCAISASIEESVAPGTHVASVETDIQLRFAAEEGVYGNRIDCSFSLKGDADGEVIATIAFSLLLDYVVTDGFVPDEEAADFVTGTTGYLAAYPYARELFQSLAARLQVDPVVLGLIRRGSIRPGTISVVPDRLLEPK